MHSGCCEALSGPSWVGVRHNFLLACAYHCEKYKVLVISTEPNLRQATKCSYLVGQYLNHFSSVNFLDAHNPCTVCNLSTWLRVLVRSLTWPALSRDHSGGQGSVEQDHCTLVAVKRCRGAYAFANGLIFGSHERPQKKKKDVLFLALRTCECRTYLILKPIRLNCSEVQQVDSQQLLVTYLEGCKP